MEHALLFSDGPNSIQSYVVGPFKNNWSFGPLFNCAPAVKANVQPIGVFSRKFGLIHILRVIKSL